jgi:membrane-bound lytic murein transglycosylase MltF
MIEGYIPALIVAFTITDDNDVILQWVEPADEADTPG